MDLNQQIKEIKQSFRLMMDGMVAASMRNKGANYKLNWGATLPRLRDKAEELKQMFNVSCLMFNQYDLAIALWKENVRECKILATMLMPADKAYTWMASDKELYQLCGFHILSRLFMNKQEPNERGINEFIDQALAALEGDSLMVKKAAMNAMIRFAEIGLVYERLAKSALKRANLDFF